MPPIAEPVMIARRVAGDMGVADGAESVVGMRLVKVVETPLISVTMTLVMLDSRPECVEVGDGELGGDVGLPDPELVDDGDDD